MVAEQLEAGRTLVQLFGRADAPKFESSVEFFAGLGDAEVRGRGGKMDVIFGDKNAPRFPKQTLRL